MPCACSGSGGSRSVTYVYVKPSGEQVTYRTEIEAMAAKVRAGNVGTVTTQAK